MLFNLAFRNELESLKEKMAKKGEEIKSKLDEREENVCHILCFIMKIHKHISLFNTIMDFKILL